MLDIDAELTIKKKTFTNATPKAGKHTYTNTWLTPQWIIDGLGGYEQFDLDPCGFKHPEKGIIVRTAKEIYTLQDEKDGLQLPWFGNVFLNFPYSEGKVWLDKMSKHDEGIVLCFARTETKAWQQNVGRAKGILFLNKRVAFLNSDGIIQTNGNAPSVLIAYGEVNFDRLRKFKEINGGILVRIAG